MTDSGYRKEMTCGEYLGRQRDALAGIGDLSAPGAVRKAEECLANIYAVSYQMNFERREPPSPHRGPAERETLDRELVAEMSDGLRHKAHAFDGITGDFRNLSRAVSCAREGNGFPLIEMVNSSFLERQSGRAETRNEERQAEAAQTKPDRRPAPAGPVL